LNPGGGKIFCIHSDPASSTMGTGSFPGMKRPDRVADHPSPSSTEVKNE
jgi:hypothetical protein